MRFSFPDKLYEIFTIIGKNLNIYLLVVMLSTATLRKKTKSRNRLIVVCAVASPFCFVKSWKMLGSYSVSLKLKPSSCNCKVRAFTVTGIILKPSSTTMKLFSRKCLCEILTPTHK